MHRPQPSEHASYYAKYIALVPGNDILAELESQRAEIAAFFAKVPDAVGPVTHPPYTWSVNQVLDHVIDGERIFAYRALRIARGDTTPLPSFDEGAFATEAQSNCSRLRDLAADLDLVRRSTIMLFKRLPPATLVRAGIAAGHHVTVRALAWIIAGHAQHHVTILKKRLAKAGAA